MPNGTLGILLICFHQKGNDLQVLETSQGGSHPQKEPVLSLLHTLAFGRLDISLVVCSCSNRDHSNLFSPSPSFSLYSHNPTTSVLSSKTHY